MHVLRVTVVLLAFAWMPAADAFAVGEVTQKTGVAACVSNDGAGGACRDGDHIGFTDFVTSPDGDHAYATAFDQHSVTVFDRDDDGELTQTGCVHDAGTAPCTDGFVINKASGIAISPDGATVYVASYDQLAVAVFDRDQDTGQLTQLAGDEGCWSQSGHAGQCQQTHGMGRPDKIVVSPNGLNVYVTGSDGGNSLLAFDRDPGDGAIEQKPGTDGCISTDGSGGACQDGRALGHLEGLAISPDGASLYAVSRFDSAIAVFDRDLGDGDITQKAGTAGCVSEDGTGGDCADGVALQMIGNRNAKNPAATDDHVYVPAAGSAGVAVFDRADDGALTQKAGTAGCVTESGTAGACAVGREMTEAYEATLSPDGRSLYTGSADGTAIFDRDPATGVLTQKAGVQGCITETGTGGTCVDGFGNGGLGGPPRVSRDGLNLYLGMGTSAVNAGIAVFDRVPLPPPPPPPPDDGGGDGGGGGGGGGVVPTLDTDLDGVPDATDNCAAVPNRDQRNADGDRQGDACDIDDDNDGRLDVADACPLQHFTTPDGCPPLNLEGITPDVGGPGDVTITIRGTGLTGAPQVRLTRAGEAPIVAEAIDTSPGGRALDGRFDLRGKTTGAYDLTVVRAGAAGPSTLREAFTIKRSGGPRITGELLGRSGALGNYPMPLLLRVTNRGNVDAVNAIVRVGGFQSGADVTVTGAGAGSMQLDDGANHGVAVSVDRVPARGSRTVFLKFLALGEAHSRYRLTTRTIADTLPAREVRPATDPSAGVVRAGGADSGSFTVRSASGAVALQYALSFRAGASRARPEIERTSSGFAFRAAIPEAGDGPPNGRPRPTTGVLELRLSGPDSAFSRLRTVRDGTGNNAVIAHRKYIADCLLARTYIDRDQHGELNRLADGGGALAALELATAQSEIQQLLSGRFETFAALFGDEWEIALMRYLEAAAQRDPTNPFFKGRTAEQRNGAVLEICRREERDNPPPPPDRTDKTNTKEEEEDDDENPPPPPPPFEVEVFYPADPNDKRGPAGYGRGRHIRPGTPMPYAIFFENKPDASAPAHEVRITDRLDASKLDLSTLELGPVFWGTDRVATPPPGLQQWTDLVDLRPAKPLLVRIDAGLNRSTGVLSWHLQGLNPDTGELEVAPELGFLPPDKAPPEGQGGVTFTVSPRAGLRTGDRISNFASIVFDRNAPIVTPTFTNTIDGTAPSSRVVSARARRGSCRDLRVTFAGSDRGAGIAYRDVAVSRNGARYRVWRARERRRTGMYRALRDGAYTFRSVATDGVGYAERSSGLWDALVTRARKRGDRLVLSLSRAGARRLGVRGLRVTVDGKRKATLRSVRSSVTVRGLRTGGHTIGLQAGTLRDARVVAMCPKWTRRR